jgi:hypothetical protein
VAVQLACLEANSTVQSAHHCVSQPDVVWAATRRVTDGPSLFTGADIAGIDPFVLHRKSNGRTDSAERLINRC